jgi:50S ribosomal subunit-associated GTPase HflX
VCVLSALLALGLLITLPLGINSDRALSDQANQALQAQKGQLEMAKAQLENPQVIDQVVAQGQQAGQIPAEATDEQKRQAAKAFMDRQLQQADTQLQQAERRRDLAANQRRIGGTGTAIVLLVAFTLLALVAVL